ncbi:MAG TPA: tetratricopeptide repeat protein [Blastocatellia bacterium]|nr:tetratricopeptide repeat protein [Blastocatellia bacterium]
MRSRLSNRGVPAFLIALLGVILLFSHAGAQAPPSIQFFMPDGSLPERELRFTLTSETGLIDTFFTDTRGRFLITRSQGLRPDAGYTISIVGDGRTFATTIYSFKLYSIGHVTVFLRPIENPSGKAGVVDLGELDLKVPQAARDAYDAAMRQLDEGHRDAAIQGLKSALETFPDYFRALNDLGVIMMQIGRNDEAAAAFERAIKIAPRVHFPRLNLGIIKTRQGKYAEAIEGLERLRKENPAVVEIRPALADALIAVNRLDEAESNLRAGLAEQKLSRPAEANARYLLGMVLNRKQRFEDAAKELTQAAKVLPLGSRIHFQLGAAFLQLGKYPDAERELLEAYRISGPELGPAQFMLGELYFKSRRYDAARRAFEQYLIDVPNAPNKAEVRGVIDKIAAALPQK